MTKRIIALFLALILTVGLLPTVALAAEETGTVEEPTQTVQTTPSVEHEAADDPIHIKKSVSKDADGNDYLTMEAYVTNPLEIKQEAVPLDIVLVLDVSGSMDENFTSSTVAKYGTYYEWTTNEQYAKRDNLYYGTGTPKSKVSVTTEAVYTPVDSLTYDDIYDAADDNGRTSYYAKDSDGQYHRLGLDWERKSWNYDFYITVDGQRNAQISDWNAQVQLTGYELYRYETRYTYKYADNGKEILTSVGADSRPQLKGTTAEFYYYTGSSPQKKIGALKDAVKSFIDNVNAQELPEGKAHRISIVTFASNAETKAGLTAVNDANAATLKNAVDQLRANGATQADKGMNAAKGILEGRDAADKTRPSVVIMFTDGVPTKYSVFDPEVAAGAINNAKTLKDGGTTVYTIAVADGANPADAPRSSKINENINWYLNAVSSNYPDASATKNDRNWTFNYGTRVSAEKDYYFTATDAQGLSMVFDTISREVSNLALVVDSTAVLSDTLSGFFTFDGVDAAHTTGITVKEVPVNGTLDASGNVTWNTAGAKDITSDVEIAVSGKSITVKGFDYGKNAVTKYQNGKVEGSKLVITFPIKPDDTATWKEGNYAYPTNDTMNSPAGLKDYALKSDPTKKDQKTLLTQSPTLPIEAHKVTYVVEENGYTGAYTTPTGGVYRTGAKYTIAAPLTPAEGSGYTFTGWCTNNTYATTVSGTEIMGTADVTLYGKFTKNTFTVTYTDGVDGEEVFEDDAHNNVTFGSEIPDFKYGTPTRAGYNFGGWKWYNATDTSAEIIKPETMPAYNLVAVAQWTPKDQVTINYVAKEGGTVNLDSESLNPDTGTATGSTATASPGYTFVGWYSDETCTTPVPAAWVDSNNKLTPTKTGSSWVNTTYYAKFTPTQYQPTELDLTRRFWKYFYSNTQLKEDQTFTIEVRDEDGDPVATAAAKVHMIKGTTSEWEFHGFGPFVDPSGTTAGDESFKMSFTAPDTYTYTVQERNDHVTGIDYDSTSYTMEVKVGTETNSSKLRVEYVKIDGNTVDQTGGTGHWIEFRNTYTKPAPNTVTFDPSEYVMKYFDSKYGQETTETFTAKVEIYPYEEPSIQSVEALEPAVFATNNTASELLYSQTGEITLKTGEYGYFSFKEKATLEIGQEYKLVISEVKGSNPYVEYDTRVYTTNIRVDSDGDFIDLDLSASGGPSMILSKYDFSFENWYTAQDDYIPIIIPTIINKDTGMLNKTDHFAYVIGYPDGTVHPNGQITRAEVATIFFRLLKDEVRDGAFTTSNSYSDVAYGKWYNNPISTMSALGIITGYPDGTFKPDKPITRAEFAAIAARFDETQYGKSATFSDVIGHWAANEIGIAYANEWIKGYPDGTFKPDQNITRAEAMTMINRVLERKPESPSDLLTDMNKWTDNMDTSKWYYLDVQEATNSHAYTRKTFNYELWRQMLTDPDWSRYER